MKNIEQWQPSKFVVRSGRLVASPDPGQVSVGSRLATNVIARYYEKHIKNHCRGKLLDLGCGKVPLYHAYREYVTEIVCLDWATKSSTISHLDFQCDLCGDLPFATQSFDTIILSDVLEHIPTPEILWREMERILAPGGSILVNTPFYYKIHEAPHDYYRYTRFALSRFVHTNSLELVTLEATGGTPEILTDVIAKQLPIIPIVGTVAATLLQKFTNWFIRTSIGGRLSQKSSAQFPLGYFLIAKKPED